MSTEVSLFWSKAKDVLAVLVIPALMWVFSVSNTLEDQRGHLREIRGDLVEYNKKLTRLEDSERQFSVQLARLETRLDGITRTTDEIRNMLRLLVNAQPGHSPSPD